jgi:hypothetical protein
MSIENEYIIKHKNGIFLEGPISKYNYTLVHTEYNFETQGIPVDWIPYTTVGDIHEVHVTLGPYQKIAGVINVYDEANNVAFGRWVVKDMTNDEKLEKQNRQKETWTTHVLPECGYNSWVFDEEKCEHVAPISKPSGNNQWSEINQEWVSVPAYPGSTAPGPIDLNNFYRFDANVTKSWVKHPTDNRTYTWNIITGTFDLVP